MLELDNERLFSFAEVENKELKHSLKLKSRLSENKDTERKLCCLFILYYKTVIQMLSKWVSWLFFCACKLKSGYCQDFPAVSSFYKSKNGEQPVFYLSVLFRYKTEDVIPLTEC